jgi:hypothetical protein
MAISLCCSDRRRAESTSLVRSDGYELTRFRDAATEEIVLERCSFIQSKQDLESDADMLPQSNMKALEFDRLRGRMEVDKVKWPWMRQEQLRLPRNRS